MIYKINDHKIDFIKNDIENHICPPNYKSNFILIPGSKVLGIYNNWYIGVINETVLKKVTEVLENKLQALHFKYWDTEKSSNALAIVKYFHARGMQGKKDLDRKISFRFIFVFKNDKNLQGFASSMLNYL